MMMAKVSIVVTVLNEERSIYSLLKSLLAQSLPAKEIIVIDAGSIDKTVEVIRGFKSKKIVVLIKNGISRSKARNLGVKLAKNEVIATTDAGCIAKKDWLKNLVDPIFTKKAEVSAGFYNMIAKNNLQKAMAVYLGVFPHDFTDKFLPSARSLAFTKNAWRKVGGFYKELKGTAEDSMFANDLVEKGVKIARVKNARVEWGMPESVFAFSKKIEAYAKGDAQTKILYTTAKGITSHNIKVLLVFLRYFAWIVLSVAVFLFLLPHYVLSFTFFSYLVYIFGKAFKKTARVEVAILAVGLAIVVDFAVMFGFVSGILER